MLQDIKQLYGRKLGATDGDIGQVQDFYFDDKSWAIRYLVADTGGWLTGRQVLLSPHAFANSAFGRSAADVETLHVNLTRKQIEDSPAIETHRPVSRQHETEYYQYYGWPAYWQVEGMWSAIDVPVATPPPASVPHHGHNQREDLHLRSMKAIAGYHLHAIDGQVGTVRSFMVDGKTWAIRELVVEAGHWYAGKTILLLPKNISRISYEDSAIFVDLTLNDIRQTAENHVAHAGAS